MLEMMLIIASAAKAAVVPPALLLAMCFQESSFKNRVLPNDGGSATMGVCGIKLITAKTVEPNIHPSSLLIPEENARIAAKFIKKLLNRYHNHQECVMDVYNKGRRSKVYRIVDCLKQNPNTTHVRAVKKHMEMRPWTKNLSL